MRRRTWFEFHDHRLYPQLLRDLFTEALETLWNRLATYRCVAPKLRAHLESAGAGQIVDLCSGGGGPWATLFRDFDCAIVLTDKYPNNEAFRRLEIASAGRITYRPESVDATQLPNDLRGFRTVVSSFHHFAPEAARAILRDAFERREGIAVLEVAQRDLRTAIATVALPLLALVTAPKIKPFRWARIFWTYCLPLIPLTLWLDGILSCLRAYTRSELEELSAPLHAKDYSWECGEYRGGMAGVLYLIGTPHRELDETVK
ncbi:class I SAM-dependent methyltransferase [Silvibacterium acidisoli]|uniref:class I SAM-dependent methyltransferase n=1 Tax=Acidobacteriaceae bacterium ZG23-2 TaxID=2883246 RepID=UPI00406C32FB